MRFHGLPAALFGSPARAAVLGTMLSSPAEWLTGREVARRAGVSPPRALEALRVLEAERLCFQRRAGRASLWSLNRGHFLARQLAPVADIDAAALGELTRLIGSRVAGAEEAYLFGSVAQGRDEPGSDVDVLLVFPSERARKRWKESLNDLQDAVLDTFGNHLEVIAYTRAAVARGGPRRLLLTARATGIRLGARP